MRFFTSVFTLLLIYTIAALLFWGLSLQRQSKFIYGIERQALAQKVDSVSQRQAYNREVALLDDELDKRRKQYIGEGSTLLLILLIGASVVYTSLQRKVRLQRQQNNFMLAVTHELKSPIAGVKLSIQTLQKHKLSEAQQSQLLSRCIQEADRLADLCNNMLITSQIEGRQYKAAKEKLSLSEVIEDAAALYASRYPDRITTFIDHNCIVYGDMLLLQMTITNLLENAIKYTPAGSPVEVRLRRGNKDVTLLVSDNGHGISDREKNKIFTKFYRIGDEATRRTKGTGLGLYLTEKIVKQHKGRLSVKDNVPHGATFEITLPLA